MDWKSFAAAFGLVFISEIGDKTQLATILLAGKAKQPWMVFAGSALALVSITALGVIVGTAIAKYVPEKHINIGSAILFIAIGVFFLVKELLSS